MNEVRQSSLVWGSPRPENHRARDDNFNDLFNKALSAFINPMSSQIKCTFKIDSWNEESFSISEDGPKLNRASVTQTYSGPLEAKSTIEYLTTTFKDEFSSFIGIEEVVGELNGKKGSFLLNHKGTHQNGVAKSSFEIIKNSGTDELSGIQGTGSYEATHEKAEMTLAYSLQET